MSNKTSNGGKTAGKPAKAPSTPKTPKAPRAPRDVSVSFDEFIALRNLSVASKGFISRLTRKNLVEVSETSEVVLARETKSAIFYKKVVKRNATLTPSGQRLLEKLNAKL